MIGVILSGGQSSRMGKDKGLLLFKGTNWAESVREKLNSLSIPTFISINPQQLVHYSNYFNVDELVVDNAELQIRGPLIGIMSAHLKHPEQDILVVACDMINLESIILKKLEDEYQHQQPEAIAFKGTNIEPLCAIYSSKGLKKIRTQYEKDALTKHSMMHVLEILETKYLPIGEEWQSYFKNFNHAEDLH